MWRTAEDDVMHLRILCRVVDPKTNQFSLSCISCAGMICELDRVHVFSAIRVILDCVHLHVGVGID